MEFTFSFPARPCLVALCQVLFGRPRPPDIRIQTIPIPAAPSATSIICSSLASSLLPLFGTTLPPHSRRHPPSYLLTPPASITSLAFGSALLLGGIVPLPLLACLFERELSCESGGLNRARPSPWIRTLLGCSGTCLIRTVPKPFQVT